LGKPYEELYCLNTFVNHKKGDSLEELKKVCIDTNIILNSPDVLLRNDIEITLSYTVLAELDKLKRDPDLRIAAQQAIKIIRAQYIAKNLTIVDIPTEQSTNDEKIVNSAKENNAYLWTDDVGASVIALANGIPLFLEDEDDVSVYDKNYIGYTEWIIDAESYYEYINKENQYQHCEIEEMTPVRAVINEYVQISPDDGSLNHRIFRKRLYYV